MRSLMAWMAFPEFLQRDSRLVVASKRIQSASGAIESFSLQVRVSGVFSEGVECGERLLEVGIEKGRDPTP